jgi:hypothetical protein
MRLTTKGMWPNAASKRIDVVENMTAGCFIGRLDCVRLPFDGAAWRICATHCNKNRDVTQHG